MQEKSVHIKTFGCQMNVYDSDRMMALLGARGYRKSENLRDADVILINTCSIRAKSEQKVLSLLGELKPLKQKKKDTVIGIAGCVGQRMGRQLLQKVPHLDLVFGPDSVSRVGDLLESVFKEGKRVLEAKFDDGARAYSEPAKVEVARVAEYLTIIKGCDHFCTYCIVPFVRGREKSRPVSEIVEDVRRLVERGTQEITFLGQNINTFGKGTSESLSLLIRKVSKIAGLKRIRYLTSHPRDLGTDLIDQFGEIENLCPALHLPFQSGSNQVLKRMARLYTREDYLAKIAALRKACPRIALSTDVIVGFPGETEEDFAMTESLVNEIGFSHAYLFKYSPRPGTRAFTFEDDIPEEVKKDRLARVQRAAFSYIEKENRGFIGHKTNVLIEGLDKKGKCYTGRNPQGKLVHVLNGGSAILGKECDVFIEEANASCLKGNYV